MTRAYQTYMGTGDYRFRLAKAPAAHHDAVKIDWEIVSAADGTVASAGIELLILDQDGKITTDHQFLVN